MYRANRSPETVAKIKINASERQKRTREVNNAAKARWRLKHGPGHERNWHFLDKYGLTLEQVEAMKGEREGRCDICKEVKPLHVDHCHLSSRVRGMLCMRCNTSLERFEKYATEMAAYMLKGNH